MQLFLRYAFSFCVLLLFACSALAATFTVNSRFDNESNGCSVGACTLREAVTNAHANGEVDVIVFDPTIFSVAQTITLNGPLPTVPVGTTLSINGPGRDLLAISGNNTSSLIDILGSGRLTISNLTVRSTNDGAGAIYNSGVLTLENVNFRDNQGANNGTSAIISFGTASIKNCRFENNFNYSRVIANLTRATMHISDSLFTGNAGSGSGTSIILNSGATMTITRTRIQNNNSRAVSNENLQTVTADLTITESEISGNTNNNSTNGGGGIINNGTLSIFSSTIANNFSNRGGAIASEQGTVTLTNTTIFGNQASFAGSNYGDDLGGGGLWLQNTSATITNSTIYKNDSLSDTGGLKKIGNATINVANTIIAGNTARQVSYFGIPINNPDAYGAFNTRGGNIIGVTTPNGVTLNNGWSTNVGDKSDVNFALIGLAANLGNNGGFAPTIALFSYGLAVGGGRTQAQSGYPTPTTDQRRVPRLDNNGVERNDAGAFQYAERLPVTAVPDLTDASDTGISSTDNITNSRAPLIKITNAIPNAKVYFFRNGNGIGDLTADSNGEVTFTDTNPPASGTFTYTTKQEIPGAGSNESAALTVTYDTTAPTVSINQANGQSDPATTQPVNFTIAFSEPVHNFGASDVSFAGTTADFSAANISLSGSGSNYTVSIENILTIGRIVADVPANQATDAAGNANPAATFSDRLVNYIGNGRVLVTKTADGIACTGSDCSLRGALSLVGSLAVPNNITINFDIPSGDSNCASGICTVGLGGNQLTIDYSTPVVIDGTGAENKIVISAGNQSRVFYARPAANATLKNLTLRDGNATSAQFPAENGDGGGITNRGTLRLENVSVLNNWAALYNGAIGNHGFLTIINSTIAGNTAYDSQFGTTGGIGSDYDMLIVNSTISGNSAPNANTGAAGGIWSTGLLYIINSTIVDNQARTFGGVNSAGSNQVFVRNSIIAANRGLNNAEVPDIGSTVHPNRIVSLGNNLVGNRGTTAYFTQPTDQTGGAGNPILAPLLTTLGNYGGATPTHALLNDSPAKDTGNNCVTTNNCANGSNIGFNMTTDQRGSLVARKIGTNVDIGAFESNLTFATSAPGSGGAGTLPFARTNENYSVTFTALRQNSLIEFTEDSGNYNDEATSYAPFTYTIAASSLPNGLTLDQNTGVLSGAPTQTGTYYFTILATDADGIAGAQGYTLMVLAPTAAAVSVGGRVLTADGRGIFGAIVAMTDSRGSVRYARTNPRGFYRFQDVAAGETYIFNASFKRYNFSPPAQIRSITEETTDINFTAETGGIIQ